MRIRRKIIRILDPADTVDNTNTSKHEPNKCKGTIVYNLALPIPSRSDIIELQSPSRPDSIDSLPSPSRPDCQTPYHSRSSSSGSL